MRVELREETLETIGAYLVGRLSKEQATAWATKALAMKVFRTDELLLEDAITALACLHDDDDRFDTAEEDLLYYRNCLQERVAYVATVEFPAVAVVAETGAVYEVGEQREEEGSA